MNIIVESSLKTLQKAQSLLTQLSTEDYCNASVSPYYSSIGSHLRHIFDFYNCIFNAENNLVDLTARNRDLKVETCCKTANNYLNFIKEKLKSIDNLNHKLIVVDDLGLGKVEMDYTYSALLAQANSHTIHHYAIINYILDRLGIEMKDSDFGYNPTTPKAATLN